MAKKNKQGDNDDLEQENDNLEKDSPLTVNVSRIFIDGDQNKVVHAFIDNLRLSKKLMNEFGSAPIRAKKARSHSAKAENKIINIVLLHRSKTPELTIDYLAKTLMPYLNAIFTIQYIVNEVLGRPARDIRIREISQNSPISVSLEGAAEAVEAIKETVVPWRRKHILQMAYFLEQERQVEIEIRKAELLEKRASAAKGRAEAEKLVAEAKKNIQETERIKLENDKLRLELQKSKIELAIEMLNRLTGMCQ